MNNSERVDLFTTPHKAVRYLLSNLLVSMGSTSFEDAEEVAAITTQLSMVLWAIDDHITHEDRHVRPALVRRAESTIATLDEEHEQHREQVAELRALAKSLHQADGPLARLVLGRTLYLHYSVFVAEALAHMAYEERVVAPLLERIFSQEELAAMHQRIVASIAPADMATWLQAILPSLNRVERAKLDAQLAEVA
jgi:iron-sulfur cluster repair protein YtfE (RIC family)